LLQQHHSHLENCPNLLLQRIHPPNIGCSLRLQKVVSSLSVFVDVNEKMVKFL
jgi:hypothetical protein